MTDGYALLRAIDASPDEDTPRLAFADWLDETAGTGRKGKQAREWAAFIRDRVAVARRPRTDPRYWDDFGRWLPVPTPAVELLPKNLRSRGVRADRGFADHLGISARQFLSVAGELETCPAPLVGLDVSQAGPHVEAVLKQPALTRFRKLDFSTSSFSSADIRRIFACPRLAQLTELRLANLRVSTGDIRALAAADTFPNLRELTLNTTDGGAGVAELFASPAVAKLEGLTLNCAAFPAEVGAALVASPHAARLRRVGVVGGRMDGGWLAAVAGGALPDLRSLYLLSYPQPVAPSGVADLIRSPRFAGFELLDIRTVPVPAAAWAAVPADPGPPGLTLLTTPADGAAADALVRSPAIGRCVILDLGQCRSVGPAHLAALGESEYARNLRVLKVDRPYDPTVPVRTGASIRAFTESPHLAGLLELELALHGFEFTDATLDALIDATFAPSLRALKLSGRFSPAGIRRLHDPAVFPNLKSLNISVPRGDDEELFRPLRERFRFVNLHPGW